MRQLVLLTIALAVFVQVTFSQGIAPDAVIDFFATSAERYHHSFFHQLRMLYSSIGPKQQTAIANLAWAPPRLGAIFPNGTEVDPVGLTGEDFLYMHHNMVLLANQTSEAAGEDWRVIGWVNAPMPNDTDWPVPPPYTIPGNAAQTALITSMKTDDFYTSAIVPAETAINDPDNLLSWSLGELGSTLENGLHFFFHQRFSAANSIGYRVQSPNPTAEVDDMWNDPSYDWLADFYSAHVSSTFWKIHGYVENKMFNWMNVNGYDRIYWVGTWEGGPMDQIVIDGLFAAALIVEDDDTTGDDGDDGDSSDSSTDDATDDATDDGDDDDLDYLIDSNLLLAMGGILSKTRHH